MLKNQKPLCPIIDWDAYQRLQEVASQTSDAFSMNCLEDALDKLIQGHKRRCAGEQLAKNLYRDCRKSTRSQRFQYIDIDSLPEKNRMSSLSDPAEINQGQEDLQTTQEQLLHSLSRLSSGHKRALSLRLSNASPRKVEKCLGVKQRQFRNIVQSATSILQKDQLLKEAMRRIYTNPASSSLVLSMLLNEGDTNNN